MIPEISLGSWITGNGFTRFHPFHPLNEGCVGFRYERTDSLRAYRAYIHIYRTLDIIRPGY